jgi:hypothetical protein
MKNPVLRITYLCLALLLIYGIVWWNKGLNSQETYTVAKSTFLASLSSFEKKVEDFVAPPPIEKLSEGDIEVLKWRSRSQPTCGIAVYVNRKFSSANPTWECD